MVNPNAIGCYKTEEELVEELKEKGKFDEWNSFGSYFGLILKEPLFGSSRHIRDTYKYYNMDGRVVDVSMITKTYREGVENIPVFRQFIVHNPTNVEQSKYRIVDIDEMLSTAGLATCTGLAMTVGTKKFMAHLDANTSIRPIITALNILVHEEEVPYASLNPFIYAGSLNSTLTLQKAKDICTNLGIPQENYIISSVCFMERVYI